MATPPQASDRVQVLDYPYALPSKCVVCGSGPEAGRKFVDFGMQIDPYGAVYFCSACVVNMANAMGFVTPERYTESQDALFDAIAENTTLEAENREFRRVFSTLSGLGAIVPAVSDDTNSGTVLSETKPDPEPQPVSKPGSKEPKTNGPGSSKESGRIPPIDGDKSGDDGLSF
jgi:hypothetical protein